MNAYNLNETWKQSAAALQCSQWFYGRRKVIKQIKYRTKDQIKIFKSRILKSEIWKEKQLIYRFKKPSYRSRLFFSDWIELFFFNLNLFYFYLCY